MVLMVGLVEVATRQAQGWEELMLVQVGQEMTKERTTSVQATGRMHQDSACMF